MITDNDLFEATGEDCGLPFSVDALDITSGRSAPRILSFLDSEHFVEDALGNPRLRALLVSPTLAPRFAGTSVTTLVVDDPRWSFYMLSNLLARNRPLPPATSIHPDAEVSAHAWIAGRGVVIGAGCVVEAFAAIHPGVSLDEGVIVRSGAIIGNTGFEHKRTTRGVVSVVHDGGVRIGRATEVGTLVNIAQGFVRRETVIGADVRIDSQSHIAHGCVIEDGVFIAAGVTISGSVDVEAEAWIGPGAVISNQLRIGARSRVGIGSVVLRDVPQDVRVLGNPARQQP